MWLFMLEAGEQWQLERNTGKFQKIHLKMSQVKYKKSREFQVLEMVKVASKRSGFLKKKADNLFKLRIVS